MKFNWNDRFLQKSFFRKSVYKISDREAAKLWNVATTLCSIRYSLKLEEKEIF